MRVLVVGRAKQSSDERAVYRACRRQGHIVDFFDDVKAVQRVGRRMADAWFRWKVRRFRPEGIVFGMGLGLEPGTLAELRTRGIRPVLWYHDLRIPPDERILERARHTETAFLTAGGQAPEWEARGVPRARFLPDAVEPDVDVPVAPDPAFASDVAFIGSGYDEYRAEFLIRLARKFDLRVWGPGWERWRRELNWTGQEARGGDYARVCASAKVVIGIEPSFQVRAPVAHYASNRMMKTVGCGGFYLGRRTEGLDQLLHGDVHCAWYRDEEDAVLQIERCLADDALRARVRAEGRAFVAAHHTFGHRLHNLLTGAPFENPLAQANTVG